MRRLAWWVFYRLVHDVTLRGWGNDGTGTLDWDMVTVGDLLDEAARNSRRR